MNQEEVTRRLLKLEDKIEDFTVTFSGKSSRKVDGLYKPDTKEIIIHNKNHGDDNSLIYTAIHEFAHHIQFTASPDAVSARAHTNAFYSIFHRLLEKAEEKGIYVNVFKTEPEFVALTKKIREEFIHVNGRLMKELGTVLTEAYLLCQKFHASFEDYVDRVLGFHRSEAKVAMKVQQLDIDPKFGYGNMKLLASIPDDDIRQLAAEAFSQGKSLDTVKADFKVRPKPADKLEFLIREKERLEKSLETITVKLAKVERELEILKYEA